MGFLDRFKAGGGQNAKQRSKLFTREMTDMCRELLDLYLQQKGVTFKEMGDLDRQVLTVYLFGLVAAVNVEEKREFSPQEMGTIVVDVMKETFRIPHHVAQVCAHEIVEQTKTHDRANPIYGILTRGEAIWPSWSTGQKDRVVADMKDVMKLMHDLQNNVPVEVNGPAAAPHMFRYHPNLYRGDDLIRGEGVCQCCGKKVEQYVDKLYGSEEVHCICLDCVQSGKAAEKFGGEFSENVEQLVEDADKTDELLHRTPGYKSWQGEYWLTCCDDYCAYLGRVGADELDGMGIINPVCDEYMQREDCLSRDVKTILSKDGPVTGYLFQCLHCGKFHLWVDIKDED